MGLLKVLLDEQTILSIMGRMPPADWKQLAVDRLNWVRGNIEEAFKVFLEQ
jgi:hypothetical protein